MDTKELINKLQPFIQACHDNGKPLNKVMLEENVPGIPSAYYHLVVQADWFEPIDECDDVLNELVDLLIESVEPKVRSYVQYLKIQDRYSRDHCIQELIVYDNQGQSV